MQWQAAVSAGDFRVRQKTLPGATAALRNIDTFHFRHLPVSIFTTALREHRGPKAAYCRSLDRLHLAAMEELKLTRLMTLDRMQAEAPESLGDEILLRGEG